MVSDLVRDERATLDGGVLPADMVHEILLRVPAKALCRLRLVCRSWRSLTSDPRFAREHLPRHPLFAARHPFWAQIHVVDLSGDIVKQIRSFEDLGCFDLSTQADLICVDEIAYWSKSKNQAHLLNPATGEITALPDGDMSTVESKCILGRIPSTGEYKVLRVGFHIGYEQPCEVITLGDRNWRAKSSPPIRVFQNYFWCRVAIDGVAYFLSAHRLSDGHSHSHSIKRDSVALFDLVAEEWRPTALQGPVSTAPDGADRLMNNPQRDCVQLAKVGGCLVMAAYHDDQRRSSLDLWFLIDVDRSLWNKRYSMRCAPHRWRRQAPYPLVVLDDGKVVTWLEMARVLKTYDLRTGTWADLAALEDYRFVGMLEGSLLCSGLQN